MGKNRTNPLSEMTINDLVALISQGGKDARSALTELGRIHTQESADGLLSLAQGRWTREIRVEALKSLGNILKCHDPSNDSLDIPQILKGIAGSLKTGSEPMRFAAASALSNTSDSIVCAPLCNASKDPSPRVRKAVAYALGMNRGHSLQTLRKMFSDPRNDVMSEAANALSKRYGLLAIPVFMEARSIYGDSEYHVINLLELNQGPELLWKVGVLVRLGVLFPEKIWRQFSRMYVEVSRRSMPEMDDDFAVRDAVDYDTNLRTLGRDTEMTEREMALTLVELFHAHPELKYEMWEGLRRLGRLESIGPLWFNHALFALEIGTRDDKLEATIDLCALEFLRQGEYRRVYELAESARIELLLTNNIARFAVDVLANLEDSRMEALQVHIGNIAGRILRKTKRDVRREGRHRNLEFRSRRSEAGMRARAA